jgi:hypothetical protein
MIEPCVTTDHCLSLGGISLTPTGHLRSCIWKNITYDLNIFHHSVKQLLKRTVEEVKKGCSFIPLKYRNSLRQKYSSLASIKRGPSVEELEWKIDSL